MAATIVLDSIDSGGKVFTLQGSPLTAGQSIRVAAGATDFEFFTPGTGTVTSVGATSPLASSGGTTPSISITGISGLGTANQLTKTNAGATAWEYATLAGTTNQVSVGFGVGTITLSLPQNIDTAATVVFDTITAASELDATITANLGTDPAGNDVRIGNSPGGYVIQTHGDSGNQQLSFFGASLVSGQGAPTVPPTSPGSNAIAANAAFQTQFNDVLDSLNEVRTALLNYGLLS